MPSWCFKGTVLLTHRIVAAPLTGGSNSSNGKSTSTGFSGTTKSYYNEINQKTNHAENLTKETVEQAQEKYSKKQSETPLVEGNSSINGPCTSINSSHGGHSGGFRKVNPFFKLKEEAKSNYPIVYQSGYSASVAFGAQAAVSIVVAIDTKGNVAIVGSYGGGGGSPSAGINKIDAISIADSVYSLEGLGANMGASGNVYYCLTAGGEFAYGMDSNGKNVYSFIAEGGVSVKAPIPAEIHGNAIVTKVLFNINNFEALGILYDLLISKEDELK